MEIYNGGFFEYAYTLMLMSMIGECLFKIQVVFVNILFWLVQQNW